MIRARARPEHGRAVHVRIRGRVLVRVRIAGGGTYPLGVHHRVRPTPLAAVPGPVLAVVLAMVLVVGALAVGASPAGADDAPLLDQKKLQKQIAVTVTPAFPGLVVGRVSCPRKIKVKRGKIVTCTVDVSGLPIRFDVTQTNKKGAITIASAQAVIAKAAAEQFVKENATLPDRTTVDCGAAPAIVKLPGETFTCAITFADGSTARTATITVGDLAGNVTLSQVA